MEDFQQIKQELLQQIEELNEEKLKGEASKYLAQINTYLIKYEQGTTDIDLISKHTSRKQRDNKTFERAAEEIQKAVDQAQDMSKGDISYYRTFIKAFERASQYIYSESLDRKQTFLEEEKSNVLREGAQLIRQI